MAFSELKMKKGDGCLDKHGNTIDYHIKEFDMGTMVRASCQCGFEQDEIYVDRGMINFSGVDYLLFPFLCKNCGSIFEANKGWRRYLLGN